MSFAASLRRSAVAAAVALYLPARRDMPRNMPSPDLPPVTAKVNPKLTAALRAAAPQLPAAEAAKWAALLAPRLAAANLATPRRVAAFVGQCAVESDYFTNVAENLRYSHAARICAVWPTRFPTTAAAAVYVNAPEALANLVYANRMGNGPPDSGDGWRFRGLGLIQITGRDEYTSFARWVGRDLEDAAHWAATPEGAVSSALWFWAWKSLNAPADAWDIISLTRRINGGLTGLADRQRACNAALAAMGET